ncbi:hypothetical protein [Streptomyces litchfieldiae]|uniref:Uncharacterized protein n=1 Tax=Streptomyces litchfieldiae TaxID=3075543 RepID=A0ABU2MU07_9ACTN|nr:hypothetical protein [Streptomyces sp. DSM 44938]MDT0344564.1 hypothetical protein [Streptomyces sp. DSM 44938]
MLPELAGFWMTTPDPATASSLDFDGDYGSVFYLPNESEGRPYLNCFGVLDGSSFAVDCQSWDVSGVPYHLTADLEVNGSTLTVTWDNGDVETYTYYGDGA